MIMNFDSKAKKLAPIILRIGLSLVFLWFGWQQLANTSAWTGLIPEYVLNLSPISAETLVRFNGSFEIVFGLCLLFGFFTQIVAFFLALHMVHITLTVGYSGIGVRDFGLAIASITMFLIGGSAFSLDSYFMAKNKGTIAVNSEIQSNSS